MGLYDDGNTDSDAKTVQTTPVYNTPTQKYSAVSAPITPEAEAAWSLLEESRLENAFVSADGRTIEDLNALDATDLFTYEGGKNYFLTVFCSPSDSQIEAVSMGILSKLSDEALNLPEDELQRVFDEGEFIEEFSLDPGCASMSIVDGKAFIHMMFWDPVPFYKTCGASGNLTLDDLKAPGQFEIWREH